MRDVPDRLAAALAGRYTLERELGRGGMATVWLARDLKHDRPVALKVLRPELAQALGPERFLREVRITAGLNHPHILPLLDSGEADGVLYYVMPYVDGESLRDRLDREKQLPLEDALRIACEVADALNYAHSHDVVHRDVKPENILLESGHAVVADFGIARAVAVAGGDRLTETGIAMGTPPYMSPEQAAGSRDLDGRSDLYSLGCVLYEMLAGRPPFLGPTAESLIHQHLAAEPPRITGIRPTVPAHVAGALERALAKTAADRFNTVARFAEAIWPRVPTAAELAPVRRGTGRRLRWTAGLMLGGALVTALVLRGSLGGRGSSSDFPAARPWVLVADFEGTADQSYRRAARDLVGTVLDQSTVAASLPTEQMRLGLELAGKPETTAVTEVVARELAVRGNIGSVVTGRLDRVGGSYSVLLRLVRAESGEVLAAETRAAWHDDALLRAIDEGVRALRARLGERREALVEQGYIPEVMTPSFEAYRLYAEAYRLYFDEQRVILARERLHEALKLDPDFASAWLLMAHLYSGGAGPPRVADSMLAALAEAERRPDRLTRAERLRLELQKAGVQFWHLRSRLAAAEQLVREVPNDVRTWNIIAIILNYMRGPEASLEVLDHISTLQPNIGGIVAWNRAEWLTRLGRGAEARQAAMAMRNLTVRLNKLLAVAALDAAWEEVDSLELELRPRDPVGAGRWDAALHYLHGEVHTGDSLFPRPPGLLAPVFWLQALAAGRPIQRPDVSDFQPGDQRNRDWNQTLGVALAGDTSEARAMLLQLVADTLDYRVETGLIGATVQAAIAWQARDWRGVIQRAGPALRQPSIGSGLAMQWILWLAADAYERLGQLDSAAVLLRELLPPRPAWGETLSGTAAHSFVLQRLIVLLARQGRVEEARRHWEIFRATFTNPDREYAHLVEETRAALEAAERR
jgi:tetratricopeptide (TPR) repeat protein